MNADERRAWAPVVRIARQAAGLSLDELAQYASTTRQTLGPYERGDSVLQEPLLVRVLDLLGLLPATDEPDVEAFLGAIRPLLKRLEIDDRQRVMNQVVRILAHALPSDVTPGFDAEAWANEWASGRTDGPWRVAREWAPKSGGLRLDMVILDDDGKVVHALEIKRGEPDPITTSAAERHLNTYLQVLADRTRKVASGAVVDVIWLQPEPADNSASESSLADQIAADVDAALTQHDLDRRSAFLERLEDRRLAKTGGKGRAGDPGRQGLSAKDEEEIEAAAAALDDVLRRRARPTKSRPARTPEEMMRINNTAARKNEDDERKRKSR